MILGVRRSFGLPGSATIVLHYSGTTEMEWLTTSRWKSDLIDNHINGFNHGIVSFSRAIFGDTAIIIDGIAPYRWVNPNAPAKWLADVEKWRENLRGSRTSTCRTS